MSQQNISKNTSATKLCVCVCVHRSQQRWPEVFAQHTFHSRPALQSSHSLLIYSHFWYRSLHLCVLSSSYIVATVEEGEVFPPIPYQPLRHLHAWPLFPHVVVGTSIWFCRVLVHLPISITTLSTSELIEDTCNLLSRRSDTLWKPRKVFEGESYRRE